MPPRGENLGHVAFKGGLPAIPRLGEPVFLEPFYRGLIAQ